MRVLERAWYSGACWPRVLLPLEYLFVTLAKRQRAKKQAKAWQAPVPVIVVGNISVGGTGKTPVVVALITMLRQAGYNPGVVSRGYGAKPPYVPYRVTADCTAQVGGDEPTMIVQRTDAPLIIDPDRPAACRALLESAQCDVIISDDGLQHYALQRDIEIAVVDSQRGLGNQHCLPVGPLREPVQRLAECDFIIINGQGAFNYPEAARMVFVASKLVPLQAELLPVSVAEWAGKSVHGVAGIGNPERFFLALEALGLRVIRHSFPDHHPYRDEDIAFNDGLPVIMTEKDAVKCRALKLPESTYYLPVDAQFDNGFEAHLLERLTQKISERANHG